jgi:hypothetical protein
VKTSNFTTQTESEDKELRKLLSHMEGEVIQDWRKLEHEKLHNLHSSHNIVRVGASKYKLMK